MLRKSSHLIILFCAALLSPHGEAASLWDDATIPTTVSANDTSAVELGVKFSADVDGFVTGLRFYKGPQNTGTHVGHLWTSTGTLLATATFTGESASGWQQVTLPTAVAVTANTTYVASYHAPVGRYAFNSAYFTAEYVKAPLRGLASGASGGNGVYKYGASGSGLPTQTFNATNYWVDVVFATGGPPPPDTTPPTVSGVVPAAGATGVSTAVAVKATFSEPMTAGTITGSTFELRNAANALVAGGVSYDGATRTATLTPSAPLASNTTYTATVKGGSAGVKDAAGNPLATDFTWAFTTAASPPPPTCPCSLWNDATIPATVSANDTSAIELGVKFRADVDGFVTGLRFYKGPQNTGTHVGHLWTSTGTLLATATFTGESASGWQQVTLPTAVAVTANTTYVASYHAPVGRYAFNSTYFTAEYVKAPLRGLASGVSGGNGVYKYGASGSGLPTQTFNAANYWVDVVFATGGSPPPDTTPPTVSGVVPAAGATGVSTAVAVKATFSEPMTAGTITGSTFELRNAANALVAGGVSYDGATRTATLTPSAPLANNTTYTATVKGGSAGVKDAAGNPLATDFTWTFTTAASPPPPTCPCSLWNDATIPTTASANDTSAVELGVKFRADVDGFVTGLRFYKGPQNTGTHVGHLWTSTGTLLATATFTGESASGWQQVTLPPAVAVTANTTYVASYHAPVGRYAFNSTYFTAEYVKAPLRGLASGASGGNGVYKYGASGSGLPTQTFNAANYWVDVVFDTTPPPPDTTPPTVSGVVPAAGATGVSTAVAVKATFSEPMTAGTITGSTFELRNAANALVAGGVSYDGATRTATLTPDAPLASNTTYTATVKGGSAGVKDAAGNALAADFTWTFATSGASPLGQWSAPFDWPLVAVNMVLLQTGKVLMYDGLASGVNGGNSARVWNPTTGAFTSTPSDVNHFCTGHSALADGRVLVVGGHLGGSNQWGLFEATIFNPSTQLWTAASPMSFARWYATATTLPDGRILATSGSGTCEYCYVPVPEIYNPASNAWTRLTNASLNLPFYPYVFVLPDVVHAPPRVRVLNTGTFQESVIARVLDVGTQTWTVVDPVAVEGAGAVMYLPGKVMQSGSSAYTDSPSIPAADTTYVLDMTQSSPGWRQTAPMAFPRAQHTTTLLPDGTALATGGKRMTGNPDGPSTDWVYEAELWSPDSETWSTMSPMQIPRLYHSTALLLPDGRVVVAGGGRAPNTTARLNAQIYSPPYLFKGARPRVTSAPTLIGYGSTFVIDTPDASSIAMVSLVRLGAVTHGYNEDQRFLNLTFLETVGGLEVQAPVNSTLAPPGYYMLFIVNADRVPSVASFVRFAAP